MSSNFDFDSINAELQAMCDLSDSQSMDMVEDNGRMIPNGFHIDSDLNYLESKPSNVFYDSRLNEEQNAILNMEVTPYIEQILFLAAQEKGTLPEPLVENEIDDTYDAISEVTLQIDREARLNEAIPLLDKYFELAAQIDEACQKYGWSELSFAKDMAWSIFKEEMDYNWLVLDRFDDKAEKRLIQLASKGQEPDEQGWQRYLEMRKSLLSQVSKTKNARYFITRKFYDRAVTLTQQCRKFWTTEGGKIINQLRNEKRELFKTLTTKCDGYSHWDFVGDYWNLRKEEISRSYLSSNDNAGVDDPEELNLLRDTMKSLRETHIWEQQQIEKGDVVWSKRLGKWLDWSLERARIAC